jgi:hypothetical protein
MLDTILQSLINTGPVGIVLAFSLFMNYKLVLRLFKIIENNTAVVQENTSILKRIEDRDARRD